MFQKKSDTNVKHFFFLLGLLKLTSTLFVDNTIENTTHLTFSLSCNILLKVLSSFGY